MDQALKSDVLGLCQKVMDDFGESLATTIGPRPRVIRVSASKAPKMFHQRLSNS